MLSSSTEGIDRIVEGYFFDIKESTLLRLLDLYEQQYGISARKYAFMTYPKWKSGSVSMSGLVAQRLINTLPKSLDFEEAYELIKIVASTDDTSINIKIPGSSSSEAASRIIDFSFSDLESEAFSPSVQRKMQWVAGENIEYARELLSYVLKSEANTIRKQLIGQIELALDAFRRSDQSSTLEFTSTVNLLGRTVIISLEGQTNKISIRRVAMSDNNEKKNEYGNEIDRIRNPQDLLNEALQAMPQAKREEVIGKAADEALRLQVKRKESESDLAIIDSKLEQAVRFGRDMGREANVDFNYEQDHRSKQGDSRISVKSKPVQESKSKFCFVATACFGNIDDPVVQTLRLFRDNELQRYAIGQGFIRTYYRHGEKFAQFIETQPYLKPPIRSCLTSFAKLYVSKTSKRPV